MTLKFTLNHSNHDSLWCCYYNEKFLLKNSLQVLYFHKVELIISEFTCIITKSYEF